MAFRDVVSPRDVADEFFESDVNEFTSRIDEALKERHGNVIAYRKQSVNPRTGEKWSDHVWYKTAEIYREKGWLVECDTGEMKISIG